MWVNCSCNIKIKLWEIQRTKPEDEYEKYCKINLWCAKKEKNTFLWLKRETKV